MTLRVLHIFAPNFKQRFGGPIFDWQYAFSHWDDSSIKHFVLDYDQNQPAPASKAFDFEVSDSQVLSSRGERVLWISKLLRSLSRHRGSYDILHFHLLWWGGLLGAGWAKRHGIPTVYQSVLLNSDTPGPILNQGQGRIKERLLRNFSVILPISQVLAEDYYAHGYTRAQVITLMNSVDTKLFHPSPSDAEKIASRQKYSLPLDATILLFTGSIIQRKGVDILIRSFIEVSQRFPDLFLLLVGPKDKGENPSLDQVYVQGLQSQVREKHLDDRVRFAGLIKDRKAMADLYRAADMFVFPSRNEGLPNVVLEAMASGLPVIVSDLPGLKPVVAHGENGWVVPIGDAEQFKAAVVHLIENPEFALKLACAARDYVEKNHSFSSWQSELVGIYQGLSTS